MGRWGNGKEERVGILNFGFWILDFRVRFDKKQLRKTGKAGKNGT